MSRFMKSAGLRSTLRSVQSNAAPTFVRPAAIRSATGIANAIRPMNVRYYSEAKEAEKAATEAAEGQEAGEAANGGEALTELQLLQQKYEAKDKEVAKFKDAYARAIADFRNLQKTTELDVKNAREYALQKFAKDLLDSVDNFDLALEAVKQEALEASNDLKGFHDGVKMVQSVFEKTLSKHGLTKMHPIGEKFDPKEHEAITQIAQPDKEPGTVFYVQQTGFKYNDRVLRAPKVGVVAGDN